MTVTYNANGGTGSVADQTIFLSSNNYLNNGNAFTREGLTLVGWATSAESDTLAYQKGATFRMEESQAGTTLNLYALWSTGTYTILFNRADVGEGEFEGEMDSMIAGVGIRTPLPSVTYRELTEFYEFDYWTPRNDGGEPQYEDGALVLNLAEAGQTVTLYAWWNPVKYYVQFELNRPNGSGLEGEDSELMAFVILISLIMKGILKLRI